MAMFHKIKVGDRIIDSIDWEMNPDLSFGTFESWGGRERVRSNNERVYYFFVDGWGKDPKLCLMERGVKHAKVIAEIKAPENIVRRCVQEHGKVALFEQSFTINEQIKDWLIANVLEVDNPALIVPIFENKSLEDMGPSLPELSGITEKITQIKLPSASSFIQEDELATLIGKWNFFEAEHNPKGKFPHYYAKGDSDKTVIDVQTGLMWQREGLDINSLRKITKGIEEVNRQGFAGYNDWRMPSFEEAMSLMEPEENSKGVHLHPCFSKNQPFIFVAAQRKPGGYWFVDYKQGRAFWSSGTIPGGFARLVRAA